MPRLAEITITNLRSIRRETFPLSDFTALIGYNNAGKTNILLGCRWLLERRSLDAPWFNDQTRPVQVEGVLEGLQAELLQKLPEDDRDLIAPWVLGGRLVIRRIQRIPGDPPERVDLFLLDPRHPKGSASDPFHPAGVDTEAALNRLFPTPLVISDHEAPATVTGKLIGEILHPLRQRYAADLDDTLHHLKTLLDMDGTRRARELDDFDRMANAQIAPLFPSVRLRLQIPAPDLSDIFRQGTLKVVEDDDGYVRDLTALGAGAQRAVQMALIRHLSEVRKHHSTSVSRTLLLIDSPELYLHPQAVELVRVALKRLAHEGYQVVFATHSAQMVTSEDVGTSLLIRKSRERGTFMRQRMEDAVRKVIQDAPSQLQMLFSLSNSNELLFAEYVLLTEGKTELRLLPSLFEKVGGQSFALIKCALVRQGGVSNTRKSMQVLGAMDLPVRAIVDLDYAFTNASNDGYLDREDPDILYCKRLFQGLATRERLRLVNGIPVNRHSSVSAADAYAMLAQIPEAKRPLQSIHAKLLHHGIWVWTQGAIEQHLGLQGKHEKVWANFLDRLRRGKWERELPDPEGIKALVQWIAEGASGRA